LYLGIWGKVLSYWKPVECQIRTDTSDRSLHFLTVRCKTPMSSNLVCIYEGVCDPLEAAKKFQTEFENRFQKKTP